MSFFKINDTKFFGYKNDFIVSDETYINCGNDDNEYLWETRECLINAFENCIPAISTYREVGTGWESSGFTRKIVVERNPQECIFKYEVEGNSFAGEYTYQGVCQSYNVFIQDKNDPPYNKFLKLKECDTNTERINHFTY